MIIDKELLEKWKTLRTHGDVEVIRKQMPKKQQVSNESIRICIANGFTMNYDTFLAVKKFYEERELANKLPTT